MVKVYNKNIPNSDRMMSEVQLKMLSKDGWLEVPTRKVNQVDEVIETTEVTEEVEEDVVKTSEGLSLSADVSATVAVIEIKRLNSLQLFDDILTYTNGDNRQVVTKAISKFGKK